MKLNPFRIFSGKNATEAKNPVQTQSSWAFRQKHRESMENWINNVNATQGNIFFKSPKEYRLDDAVGERLLANMKQPRGKIQASKENVHLIPASLDDIITASDVVRSKLEALSARIETLEKAHKTNTQAI